MTEASDAAKPEEATAGSGSDTVPAYSWYALGVLVLIYVLNFIDRQIEWHKQSLAFSVRSLATNQDTQSSPSGAFATPPTYQDQDT